MHIFWVLLLLFLSVVASPADLVRCAACGEQITEKLVWAESYMSLDKRPLCPPCSQLTTTCFICGLPTKKYTTLNDGRLLCEQDAAVGVTSLQDAEQLFREAKRDSMRILAGSGVLPDRNVKLTLLNKRQIDSLSAPPGPGHAKQTVTMGLTGSRLINNDEWEHTIYVLDHLPPARFAAVCAQEYSHAWIA